MERIMSTPRIAKCSVYPVAGRDSMELNLSGAHAPYFTRNVLVLEDTQGNLGLGEVPDRWLRGREFLLLKKSFDVFTNPNTGRLLDHLDPDEVVVFGVATDVCDDAAIRGFLERGLTVRFVEDAARGLDEDRVAKCTSAWRDAGVEFTTADEVISLLSG